MSADNGIYILKTKDQYRVIYAQAIENLYYSYFNSNNLELVPTRVFEYYGESCYTRDFDKAMRVAYAMSKSYPVLEYGIKVIETNKTWSEIIQEAKKLAIQEIELVKKTRPEWYVKEVLPTLEKIVAS